MELSGCCSVKVIAGRLNSLIGGTNFGTPSIPGGVYRTSRAFYLLLHHVCHIYGHTGKHNFETGAWLGLTWNLRGSLGSFGMGNPVASAVLTTESKAIKETMRKTSGASNDDLPRRPEPRAANHQHQQIIKAFDCIHRQIPAGILLSERAREQWDVAEIYASLSLTPALATQVHHSGRMSVPV